jgi:MftR C-terminal domain
MVAAEAPLAAAIAERTGADPQGDLHPRVLAAAVMAAVRTATAQWGISDGSLPDLIRQAVRQVADHSGPESNQPDNNQPR